METLLNRHTVSVPFNFHTELGTSYTYFDDLTGRVNRIKEVIPVGQEGRYNTSTFTVFFESDEIYIDRYLGAVSRDLLFIGEKQKDGNFKRILSYKDVPRPHDLVVGVLKYDDGREGYLLTDIKPVTLIPTIGMTVLDLKPDDRFLSGNIYHIGHDVVHVSSETVDIKLGS